MEFVFETEPDAAAAAVLARRAFGRDDPLLSPERFLWTYGTSRDDVIVLAAIKDGQKVGQGVFLLQPMQIMGKTSLAAQYVDLFVDPSNRGGPIVMGLYKRLLERAQNNDVDLIFATPNQAARELNRKLMGLNDIAEMPYRIGAVIPLKHKGSVHTISADDKAALNKFMEAFTPQPSDVVIDWSASGLARRLSHPHFRYSLHATDNAVMIVSPRTVRRTPLILVTAILVKAGHRCGDRELRALLGAAAAYHHRPLFVYAGINDRIDNLPGRPVPDWLKAPILVQGRFLKKQGEVERFTRSELIDFDFA